jgi:hypothetical protein
MRKRKNEEEKKTLWVFGGVFQTLLIKTLSFSYENIHILKIENYKSFRQTLQNFKPFRKPYLQDTKDFFKKCPDYCIPVVRVLVLPLHPDRGERHQSSLTTPPLRYTVTNSNPVKLCFPSLIL